MSERDVFEVCEHLRALWPDEFEIQTGDDHGQYINCLVNTLEPSKTWKQIQRIYVESQNSGGELARASIITVTGDNGWNDYLLLHHYDSSEQLDTMKDR